MGRNRARPGDYKPFLEFYLRRKAEGGKLLSPGKFHPDGGDPARRECLLLVHGFNNTDSETADAYLGFRARQSEIFKPSDPFAFERVFGDAFWPGDADWWWIFDKVDFLVYPSAVHASVNAAKELANLIGQMPNLEQIDFIGHSLGCRVTLEALLLLRSRAVPRVRRVVLMAAAVPSEMLERGGKFFDLLTQLAAEGTRIDILHSMQDTVLHFAFPPGQALAGRGEGSARALGRFGPSPMMPGYRTMLAEREITSARHGDYWGHSKTDPSRVATEEAGRFLALGDVGREIGFPRKLGTPASEGETRTIGNSRELSEIG